MYKKKKCQVAMPQRKELSDNPVKLCHEISRIFHTKLREGAELEGVMSQPGARLVLSFLAIGDGINQRQLVEATHLRAPTVSAILKKMEEEGMVIRAESDGDRREMLAYLTDHGRATDRAGLEKIKKYDAIALRGISPEEERTMLSLMLRMRENLLSYESDDQRDSEKGE